MSVPMRFFSADRYKYSLQKKEIYIRGFSSEVSEDDLKAIAEISHHTRIQSMNEAGKVTSMVSTRASVEMAGLVYDGFDLFEAAEISIFPFFSNDGGVDSERTYVKQLVQKYIKDESDQALFTEQTEEVDDIPMF